MGYDPNEARDPAGQWTAGSAAGKAAGAKLAQRATDVARTGTVKASGGGAYKPGAWQEVRGKRDKVADLKARTDRYAQIIVDEAAKKGVSVTVDNDAVQMQAKRIAKEDVAGDPGRFRTFANGPHMVNVARSMIIYADIGDEKIQHILDHVDHMQTVAPLDKVNVWITSDDDFNPGVAGETVMMTGLNHIRLNARELYRDKPAGGDPLPASMGGTATPREEKTWWAPAARQAPRVDYIVTHEWGHTQSPADKDTLGQMAQDHPPISDYAKTNPEEAYAEAFAEYQLSGGQTTSETARAYADKYGWRVK